MDIVFRNLSIDESKILIAIAEKWLPSCGGDASVLLTAPGEPEKLKRPRRTKAEMAQARHEEEEKAKLARQAGAVVESPESEDRDGEEEPVPRRRRRRSESATEEATEGNLRRGRRRREGVVDPTPTPGKSRGGCSPSTTTKSPSDDEISDEDVMRVASEGAQHLTPKVVTEVLEEFGVAHVGEFDQEQRREFIDQIESKIKDLPEQREAPAKPARRRRLSDEGK